MRLLGPRMCPDGHSRPAAVRRKRPHHPSAACAPGAHAHARSAPVFRSYFFEIRRTFAPIVPELSLARVPRSKRQVALKLRKHEQGVEWPALRCFDFADALVNPI